MKHLQVLSGFKSHVAVSKVSQKKSTIHKRAIIILRQLFKTLVISIYNFISLNWIGAGRSKKLTNTQLEIKREAKNFLPYHLIICCFFAFRQSFLQLSQNVYLCNTTTPNASLTQGTAVDKTVPKAPIQAGSCKTGRSMWICLGSAEWAPYFYSSLVGYLISTQGFITV